MLSIETTSKNEDIQILENGQLLAELKYAPGTYYKMTATYGVNEMQIKLKVHWNSLLGMHKFDILKNGKEVGKMSIKYLGSFKISWQAGAVEEVYKVKHSKGETCTMQDVDGNKILNITSDFKILKFKPDIRLEVIDWRTNDKEKQLERLILGLFCANSILFSHTIAD